MKKSLTFVALLLATLPAFALDPYSLLFYQADPTGSYYVGRILTPAGDAIIVVDGASQLPKLAVIGSGLNWDGTTLSFVQPSRTFSYPTRSLNTCFRPSASYDTAVNYSVDIGTSLSLTTGAQGTVYLRTYTDSGCTAGTQEIGRFTNGQIGTLTIGLALTQTVTAKLPGIIPAGHYVQLVTENTVGSPTFTARPGQEVIL